MSMTYQEFKDKWNGKYCEMGGSVNALNQCTDCANAYISEVLGLPIVLGTNAVDFPKKCLPPNYEYILNTPTAVPIQGDIMIYKSPDGIGHIDIFDNGNDSNFVAFSQNWPLKSVCKLVNHTYTGTYTVVGWLRGKSIIPDMTDDQKKALSILESFKTEFNHGNLEGAISAAIGAAKDIPAKDEQILILTNKVHELELQVVEINKVIDEIKLNYIEKEKEVVKWQKLNTTANANLNEQILKNEELDRLAKDNKNLYLQKNDAFNNLNAIFEEYKKCNPQTETKFNLIQFIISLFKK